MSEGINPNLIAIEERTLAFAQNAIDFISSLPKTAINIEVTKQVAKSSSAIGVACIAAKNANNKFEFTAIIKTCQLESEIAKLALERYEVGAEDEVANHKYKTLLTESNELVRAFDVILEQDT